MKALAPRLTQLFNRHSLGAGEDGTNVAFPDFATGLNEKDESEARLWNWRNSQADTQPPAAVHATPLPAGESEGQNCTEDVPIKNAVDGSDKPQCESAFNYNDLKKPKRNGPNAWRPNPSFSPDDKEKLQQVAAFYSMTVGTFITALCHAFIYEDPFILNRKLRPTAPPMSQETYRVYVNLCSNLNQIAKIMNQGRLLAMQSNSDYPHPPEELSEVLSLLLKILEG